MEEAGGGSKGYPSVKNCLNKSSLQKQKREGVEEAGGGSNKSVKNLFDLNLRFKSIIATINIDPFQTPNPRNIPI